MSTPALPEHLVTAADPAGYAVDTCQQAGHPEAFTVVEARCVDDVVDVLRYAQDHRVPVVPQGARTATTRSAEAVSGGIVLSCLPMTDLTVLPEEKLAIAGPGVLTDALKHAAAEHGLAYPPDPASAATCTIGGNVATNAGGLCCVKYGVTADYVRGLQVVLPGGEVMRTGRRTAKGVAGYDLTGLFVGSEGTLGVITEVAVRLVPAADAPATLLAVFDSLQDAVAAISALRDQPHLPSMLEVLDRFALGAICDYGDFGLPRDAEAVLLVQADRPGATARDAQRYGELMQAAGAREVSLARDEEEAGRLLAGRRAMNPSLSARGSRLNEDVCVPVTRLLDLLEAVHTIRERRGVEICTAGHAGDGNFHPNIFFEPADPDSVQRAHAALDDLFAATLELGGTITGEHGIGVAKAAWLRRELGDAEWERQRAVKAVFDPLGIMNPGKVFA